VTEKTVPDCRIMRPPRVQSPMMRLTKPFALLRKRCWRPKGRV
jgi:hypothetical protein